MCQQSNGKSDDVRKGNVVGIDLASATASFVWAAKSESVAAGDGSGGDLDEWEESSYEQLKTRTPLGEDQRHDLCWDTRPSRTVKKAIYVCQIRATYSRGPVRAVISIALSSDVELKMK